MIGIVKITEENKDNLIYKHHLKKYGKQCYDGDIIEMILDLKKLELKFIINDEDHGKAFDVDKEEQWNMIVR